MTDLLKYPRTQHIEGSRLQDGDEDLAQVPFASLAGRNLVVEEKMDGANSGISFTDDGVRLLQSRGHFLTGGARERHFNLLKQWASVHDKALRSILGARYIAYGEWMYAKHAVFYDLLPHYFMEFDVYDREEGCFLSTPRRRELWAGSPVTSVAVLHEGPVSTLEVLKSMIGPSLFVSEQWKRTLAEVCAKERLDEARVFAETANTGMMEGLYLKLEENGCVTGRYKFVRAEFLQSVVESGSHWLNRPIVPNRLSPGTNIFAGAS